jgi:hypothetical protein
MSLLEYAVPLQASHWQINDDAETNRWTAGNATFKQAVHLELEEEIHLLRMALERLVLGGQALTSHSVIQKSMELDLKIIEYMHVKEGQPDQ